jgi:DNA gyrase/topoisomerase IV subunit A
LQAEHIGEIDAALAMVENRGIDWREITAPDFPLPGLTDLIGQIRNELENGCGLMKLRGLPVSHYNENQLRTLYFGIGRIVGSGLTFHKRYERPCQL